MTIYNAFWQLIWPDRILHNLLMPLLPFSASHSGFNSKSITELPIIYPKKVTFACVPLP
jgi:hypothetical protein